jgi:hypothetical protein
LVAPHADDDRFELRPPQIDPESQRVVHGSCQP